MTHSVIHKAARLPVRIIVLGIIFMLAACAQKHTMHMAGETQVCPFSPALSVHCGRTPTASPPPRGITLPCNRSGAEERGHFYLALTHWGG